MNREAWLNAIAARMAPRYAELGHPLPPFRISIGFTSGGMNSNANAECWSNVASADKHFEILIRPDVDDPMYAAALTAHELTHAAVGLREGHKGKFVEVMKALGLTKPFTSTVPTEAFNAWVKPFVDEVGAFPHARLNWRPQGLGIGLDLGAAKPAGRTKVAKGIRDGLEVAELEEIITSAKKKQTTRLKKAECGLCGYTVRVTQKWLEVGPPHCPKHGAMELAAGEEEPNNE